ncbi:zinc ribbon domain-containing protein [Paraliobacillus salinarum]|uniref:zinc ribbon domain-containing protein n=1 Tax=Paraliobacillus salinarum TaxID=1158996 RepID=UPI0015F66B6C|nr:zinc-ribbon domain-containing protein [Paraliobacillus salinarum]
MSNFCKSCGRELKEGARFCPECGTPVAAKEEQKVSASAPASEPKESLIDRIKRAPKKQKIIAASVIAIIILFVGTYQVGAMLTDKDRVVDKFEEALINKDATAMKKLVESSDKQLKITKDDIKSFMKVMEDVPSQQQYFIDELNAQSLAYESNYEPNLNSIFSLVKKGKTALIFDKYVIEVMPFYVEVGTNMKDAQILLNNDEVATSDSNDFVKEIGPLFPGVYSVSANYKNDYAALENQVNVSLLDPYTQAQYLDLSLYGEYVSFDMEYEDIASDITYFVNDKEIALDDEEEFGPVSIDGSIEAYGKLTLPWGEVTSKKTPIEGIYTDLEVPLPVSEEVATEIINTIHTYGGEFSAAYKNMDAEKFTSVTKSYKNDEASDIEYMQDYDRRWKGTYQKTIVDLESFYAFEYDGNYGIEVNAQLHFADSASYYTDDEEVEIEDVAENLEIELHYDPENKAWLVNDISELWDFEATNTEERTVKTQ